MAFAFGLTGIFISTIFTFTFPVNDPFSETISWVTLYGGILLLIIGIVLVPGVIRETKKTKSIIEIVSVRKEITISEISSETGLDREYIQEVVAKRLIIGSLHGYLEDDLFVRDTGARRRYSTGQMGLSSDDD